MTEWDDLADQARREPLSHQWLQLMQEAIDRADAAGAQDDAFHLRFELIRDAHHVGAPLPALTAFAWCQARYDEDPDRYAGQLYLLDWYRKWMPSRVTAHPTVPMERIVAMVDDVEARHVAAGNGRRQAIALRMDLKEDTGFGPPLADLLADWRASARSSVSDCPACEALQEATALSALGRRDEGAVLLAPFVRGERPFCGDGPAGLCTEAAEVLIDRDPTLGREAFHTALRASMGEPEQVAKAARLTSLAARTGAADLAWTLLRFQVPLLLQAPDPLAATTASAHLARALAAFDDGASLGLDDRVVAGLVERFDGFDVAGDLATVGPLRTALVADAERLARRFDERDGATVRSDAVAAALALPDRPDLSIEAPAPAPTAPTVVPAPTDDDELIDLGAAAIAPDPDELGPAPTDPEAFHEWAGRCLDRWELGTALDAAVAILDDPAASPDLRAVAGRWAAGSTERGRAPDVVALVDDPRASIGPRSRLAANLASALAGEAPDAAEALFDRSVALYDEGVAAGQVSAKDAAGITCRFVWRCVERGDVAAAEAHLEQAKALVAALPDATASLVAQVCRLEVDVAGMGEEPDPDRLTAGAHALAEACLAGLPASWAALDLVHASRVLGELGNESDAARWVAVAAATMVGAEEATIPRFSASLLLADLEMAARRPEEAMAAQRAAIAAARDLGEGALGWARRGLGFQLSAVGRLDEAVVQLADAADLLRRAGDDGEAIALELRRARIELDLEEPVRAERIAERVLAEVPADADADDEALGLRFDALEVSAMARSNRGEHRGSADRWLELAGAMELDPAAAAWNRSAAALEVVRIGAEEADEAIALAEASLDLLERVDWPDRVSAVVLERAARVHAWVGRFEDGRQLAVRARGHAEAAEDLAHALRLRCFEADLLWDLEQLEDARSVLVETAALVDELGVADLVGPVHGRLADLCGQLGREDEARQHQARVDEAFGGQGG